MKKESGNDFQNSEKDRKQPEIRRLNLPDPESNKRNDDRGSGAKRPEIRPLHIEKRPPEAPAERQGRIPAQRLRPISVPPGSPPEQRHPARRPGQEPEKKSGVKAGLAGTFDQVKASIRSFPSTWRSNPRFRRMLRLSLALLLALLFYFLPLFRIQKIESTELYFVDLEEVLSKTPLHLNQHFLHAYGGSLHGVIAGRYEGVEKSVLHDFPGLSQVEIQYQFPGTIFFDLKERIPVAYLDVRDGYITLDRYGVAVSSGSELPQGIPLIRGIDVIQLELGKLVSSNADAELKSCIDVMSSIVEADFENQSREPLLPRVKEIRAVSDKILLQMDPMNNGQELRVSCRGNRNLKDEFIWLSKVLDSGVLSEKLPGSLDIYGSQLVFRPEKSASNADNEEISFENRSVTPAEMAKKDSEADESRGISPIPEAEGAEAENNGA